MLIKHFCLKLPYSFFFLAHSWEVSPTWAGSPELEQNSSSKSGGITLRAAPVAGPQLWKKLHLPVGIPLLFVGHCRLVCQPARRGEKQVHSEQKARNLTGTCWTSSAHRLLLLFKVFLARRQYVFLCLFTPIICRCKQVGLLLWLRTIVKRQWQLPTHYPTHCWSCFHFAWLKRRRPSLSNAHYCMHLRHTALSCNLRRHAWKINIFSAQKLHYNHT